MSSFLRPMPLVISYYTLGTPYEEEVKYLIRSCEQFGVDSLIEGIPCKGSWEANCAFKPFFIREKMKELQRPLFWVDADAVFLQTPDLALFLDHDFAVLQLSDAVDINHRIRASSVFINTTFEGYNILEAWCKNSEDAIKEHGQAPAFLDQISLYLELKHNQSAEVAQMPLSYCKVFDYDSVLIDQKLVVIEQNQASRRLRSFFQAKA